MSPSMGVTDHVGGQMTSRSATAAYGAHTIALADRTGEVIAEHPRRFDTPCNGPDAAS